jgi:hypothetical protein
LPLPLLHFPYVVAANPPPSKYALSAVRNALGTCVGLGVPQMREVLFQVDLTNRTAAEAEDVDIFDAALYKRLGLLIGLDMRAFTKCLNTNRHHSEARRSLPISCPSYAVLFPVVSTDAPRS